MTMRLAPIAKRKYTRNSAIFVLDPTGGPICALECGACVCYERPGWIMANEGVEDPILVNYCPECGRQLDFDAEGNPTVGLSAEELEAQRDALAERFGRGERRTACLLAWAAEKAEAALAKTE